MYITQICDYIENNNIFIHLGGFRNENRSNH